MKWIESVDSNGKLIMINLEDVSSISGGEQQTTVRMKDGFTYTLVNSYLSVRASLNRSRETIEEIRAI